MITNIIEQIRKLDDKQIKELAAEIFKFDEEIATSIAFTISSNVFGNVTKVLVGFIS